VARLFTAAFDSYGAFGSYGAFDSYLAFGSNKVRGSYLARGSYEARGSNGALGSDLESNEVRGLKLESRAHRFDAFAAFVVGSDQKRSWFSFSFLNGGMYFAISNYLFYELLV
jgi:hypothetical protein